MFINALSGSRFSSRAIPRNGLTNTLSYSQSKPERYTTSPQQMARRAVGDRRHQRTFTQPQPCGNQDAGNRHYARGNFRVNTRPCASSVVCGSTLQRRHNQRANKGRQNHQDNQRQMVGNPLPCMSMNLFFTVEYDENHPEGVQEVMNAPTRPATIRLI